MFKRVFELVLSILIVRAIIALITRFRGIFAFFGSIVSVDFLMGKYDGKIQEWREWINNTYGDTVNSLTYYLSGDSPLFTPTSISIGFFVLMHFLAYRRYSDNNDRSYLTIIITALTVTLHYILKN